VAKKGKKTTESINSRLQLVIKSGEGLVLGMLWRDAGRRAWGSGAFYQRSREGGLRRLSRISLRAPSTGVGSGGLVSSCSTDWLAGAWRSRWRGGWTCALRDASPVVGPWGSLLACYASTAACESCAAASVDLVLVPLAQRA
jgi:hypothetical protein